MKHWLGVAFVVSVSVSLPVPRVDAVPLDAITVLANVNAGGHIVGVSNVLGTLSVTSQSLPPAPGNPPDVGSGTASTVGFYDTFVIAPGFISNIGRSAAAASTINTAGPTGVGVGVNTDFRLFIEVIPSPALLAAAAANPSVLSDVQVDVGWHVAGSKTSGGNDFARITVGQLVGSSPSPFGGQIIKFIETAVDADLSGVTTAHVNLSPGNGLSNQLMITLLTQCFTTGFSVVPAVSATSCSAVADPTFSISASNPFPDQLTLAFSPNLAPEAPPAVPEPTVAWLIVSGVVGLTATRRLRRFTA
jgi:hypothetical protein